MLPSKLVAAQLQGVLILACLLLGGCAARLHEKAPNLDAMSAGEPWLVHCETAMSLGRDTHHSAGLGGVEWLVAMDSSGSPLKLSGQLEDGFFMVRGVAHWSLAGGNASHRINMDNLRASCLATMAQSRGKKANELLAVRAFRKSDRVNIAIDFDSKQSSYGIRRLVVFSDSLSDSGKLKARLKVLPGPPYWAGRFSNGPNWIDYLEAWSTIPVQNHSFGGASVTGADNISRQNLYALIHDGGQYFVSGSIDHQIDDYGEKFLVGATLQRPGETAFLVWTGSNDYISKEPFSGAIDTLLNHPLDQGGYQAVVDAVIEATHRQLERIYALGGRYILIANLPDLGDTPIVLQNNTYSFSTYEESDDARRLALASRLSDLSQYHNEGLARIVATFRADRPDVQLLEFDADQAFTALLQDELPEPEHPFKPGFSPQAQGVLVRGVDTTQIFQQRCYRGGYFGSSMPSKTCDQADKVVFWDVIHPTTFAHCWTAYLFGMQMSRAGWLEQPPPLQDYKAWCEGISGLMRGHKQVEDVLSPHGLGS